MENFINNHQTEILYSALTLGILLVLRFIVAQTIRRIGKLSDINKVRTRLIVKYVNITILFIALLIASFIWGVNFKELALVFSSIFAVLGVALFAQWSILSNLTSGIILFFSFPFKIGDRIRIQDIDFPNETIIEDIKAFHINLRTDEGELITYPNNLLLQKGIVVLDRRIDDYTTDSA